MAEPFLVSIAAALAGKAVTSLYEFVQRRFARDADKTDALEAARDAGEGTPEAAELAEVLQRVSLEDPEFDRALRAWQNELPGRYRSTNNEVSGVVYGKVVQAGDVHGDINL